MASKEKRVVIDCRDSPESNCSVAVSGREDEVLDLVCYHAVHAHGYPDNPSLKEDLRKMLKPEEESSSEILRPSSEEARI